MVTVSADAEKGYVFRNRKELALVISDKAGRVLLKRSYSADAGSLKWAVKWQTEAAVSVCFFEERATDEHAGERQILYVHFERLPDGGFIEGGVPAWVSEDNEEKLRTANAWHKVQLWLPSNRTNVQTSLEWAETVAAEFHLRVRKIADGLIGPLATYEGEGLRLQVVEYESTKLVEINVEDWGHRELARQLWSRFSTVSSARWVRSTEIVLRASLEQYKFVATVDEIAGRRGFQKNPDCAAAYLACYVNAYGARMFSQVRPQENELSTMLIDPGWSSDVDAIERELRRVVATKE